MNRYTLTFTSIVQTNTRISFSISVLAVNEYEALKKITRDLPKGFISSDYPTAIDLDGPWSDDPDCNGPLHRWLENNCP